VTTSSDQQRLLDAALLVFREVGFTGATLELIARQANVSIESLRSSYSDKAAIFSALITTHSPIEELKQAIDMVEGDTAEDIVRDAMRRMVSLLDKHQPFVDLAAMDVQSNNGAVTANFSMQILPHAMRLLERLKATGELRPVSDMILARTFAAMLIGFIASERAMPQMARFAIRFFPQKAWLDGTVDLMLYGILEDKS
jgi:AcrR family transcriptional regulator